MCLWYDTATGVPVGELQIGDYPGSQWTGRQWAGLGHRHRPQWREGLRACRSRSPGRDSWVWSRCKLNSLMGVATQGTELALGGRLGLGQRCVES